MSKINNNVHKNNAYDTNDNQNYKKPSFLRKTGSFFAGTTVVSLAATPFAVLNSKLMDKLAKISNLKPDEFIAIDEALNTTITKNELNTHGVNIKKIPTFAPKNIAEKILGTSSPFIQLEQGKNAIFMPKKALFPGINYHEIIEKNTVLLPEKNLLLCGFHELGHAHSANIGKFSKLLFNTRILSKLALPIGLIGLLKTKKAPDEKSSNPIGRATDFIKNNAGKLTVISLIPMLIDEARASIKGIKFAKEAGLSADLIKKVIKTNKIAYCTYLSAVVASSASILVGIKAKDSIAHPILVENNKK